jgi:predicted RNA-binding Zn-ribbon protein involved in translation (DUF1610 family)
LLNWRRETERKKGKRDACRSTQVSEETKKMTARLYRCPRCGNMGIYHDCGLRKLICTKCKAPLRNFKKDTHV